GPGPSAHTARAGTARPPGTPVPARRTRRVVAAPRRVGRPPRGEPPQRDVETAGTRRRNDGTPRTRPDPRRRPWNRPREPLARQRRSAARSRRPRRCGVSWAIPPSPLRRMGACPYLPDRSRGRRYGHSRSAITWYPAAVG